MRFGGELFGHLSTAELVHESIPASFSGSIVRFFSDVGFDLLWRAGHDCIYPKDGCGSEELA